MKLSLEQLFEDANISEKVTPLYRTVHYTFRPTTKSGRKEIMQGNYPDEFHFFMSLVRVSDNDIEIGNVTWMKDPENPSLIVEIHIYDGELAKQRDMIGRHLYKSELLKKAVDFL